MQYAKTTTASKYVDDGVLEQRDKHEEQTHRHPDVDRFDVRHARHRRVDHRRLGGRRQHRQQADGDARWTGVDVDPEGHPGQDDDEHARHVDLDQEIAEVPTKNEPDLKTWKGSWYNIHSHSQ